MRIGKDVRRPLGRVMTLAYLGALLVSLSPVQAQEEASTMYLEAREHLIEERFEHALVLFREVVTDHGESSRADDAQYYIGYTLERMGQSSEAVTAFEELIRRWPESSRVESARSHLVDLHGVQGGMSRQVPLEELLSSGSSWESRRDLVFAMARAGDFSGVSVLEDVMRRESSSRQQELIRILGGHLSNQSARRVLALALEPSRSSSVQLLALKTLQPVAGQQDVAGMIEMALARNNSSSVQLEAIRVLRSSANAPHVQRVLVMALESGIGSSVKISAIRALDGYLLDEAVRPSVVRLFQQSESSSVLLEALKGLDGDVERAEIAEILSVAAHNRNTSSVQIAAMRLARSSGNPVVRQAAGHGLARGTSSSVQIEAARALAGGENEEAAAEALESMLRERSTYSSVMIEGLRSLTRHMGTAAAPRAVAAALHSSLSSSVLLEALDLAEPFALVEPVRTALRDILKPGSAPSSVKLKAIKVLGRRISEGEIRALIAVAIDHSNSSSVQLAAIETLEDASDQRDTRELLFRGLDRRSSSSVILSAVKTLEPWVARDQQIKERFIEVMEERQISSSARVRTAEALLPGADNGLKRGIVAAMEDVCQRRWEQSRRNRIRFNDNTIRDAIAIVGEIDPEKARELKRKYGRPPSLLQWIFGAANSTE